jgi:hypothetical protein
MKFKTTIEISRDEAIRLIKSKMEFEITRNMLNKDLEYMVEDMGFGDNPDWEYYGHNFFVVNKVMDKDFA